MTTGNAQWYATHPDRKRSIKDDYKGFCGWNSLGETLTRQPESVQNLVAVTFLTGGRATEVLSLKPSQFSINKDRGIILVQRMTVLKQHEKVGGVWVRKKTDRTFPILLDTPLTPYLLNAINAADGTLFNFGYKKMWAMIAGIDIPEGEKHGEWFPHRLRAERASQILVEHKYDVPSLMSWFGWSRAETAIFYAKLTAENLIQLMLRGKM